MNVTVKMWYSHASYFRVIPISTAFRIPVVNISQRHLLPVCLRRLSILISYFTLPRYYSDATEKMAKRVRAKQLLILTSFIDRIFMMDIFLSKKGIPWCIISRIESIWNNSFFLLNINFGSNTRRQYTHINGLQS